LAHPGRKAFACVLATGLHRACGRHGVRPECPPFASRARKSFAVTVLDSGATAGRRGCFLKPLTGNRQSHSPAVAYSSIRQEWRGDVTAGASGMDVSLEDTRTDSYRLDDARCLDGEDHGPRATGRSRAAQDRARAARRRQGAHDAVVLEAHRPASGMAGHEGADLPLLAPPGPHLLQARISSTVRRVEL